LVTGHAVEIRHRALAYLFVALLGLAPFLVPTRDKVAAKFNDQTFKAAAAIKLFAN
jgi:hypothetical protein